MLELTKSITEVFESLEKVSQPTLHLVAPSYYLLARKFKPQVKDSRAMHMFRRCLMKYLDEKFWTSIIAFHWMATFLDPSFKHFAFIPQTNANDVQFKRDLLNDLDDWMLAEMNIIHEKMSQRIITDEAIG